MAVSYFIPEFVNLLNILAMPLQKPKHKYYNFYVVLVIVLFTSLMLTSLVHIFQGDILVVNPMNAILHILVYVVINTLDFISIMQGGFLKSRRVDKLLRTMDEVRTLISKKMRFKNEKRLQKLQRFDFFVTQITLIPWILFMFAWIMHVIGLEGLLVYSLVYVNYYLTAMEVMKMSMLLQYITLLARESNYQLLKLLSTRNYLSNQELKSLTQTFDKLIDSIKLFNECFGLEILGTVIVTPLVAVQAFFFSLSRVIFPSLIRTIMVNLATTAKFVLFLVLSFMIATPSKRIRKEFQNTGRICNTFKARLKDNKEVESAIELVSVFMQYRETNISAAGFFDADYTIILNIIVSTVTYLIAFLQINAELQKAV